jgi:hypothetical protein
MYGGKASKIGILAKKTSVVDNTPNAVDWTNILTNGTRFTTQQITSISSSITVQVTASGSPGTRLFFKIDTTVPSYTSSSPSFYGFTQITAFPVNITVNNNEYLSFGMNVGINRGSSSTVTVTNTSDSNTVLDTFLMSF